jgi:acyl dehydratase
LRPYINEFTLTKEDVEPFAVMSGDVNPMHVDEAFAHDNMFHKIIAHGMWGGALISTVLGTELPGAGTIYCSQTLNFRRPILLGDTVVVTVTVREKNAANRCVVLDCRIVNQNAMVVIDGAAEIIAPTKKVRRGRVTMPEVHIEDRGAKHRLLIAQAQNAIRLAPAPEKWRL